MQIFRVIMTSKASATLPGLEVVLCAHECSPFTPGPSQLLHCGCSRRWAACCTRLRSWRLGCKPNAAPFAASTTVSWRHVGHLIVVRASFTSPEGAAAAATGVGAAVGLARFGSTAAGFFGSTAAWTRTSAHFLHKLCEQERMTGSSNMPRHIGHSSSARSTMPMLVDAAAAAGPLELAASDTRTEAAVAAQMPK